MVRTVQQANAISEAYGLAGPAGRQWANPLRQGALTRRGRRVVMLLLFVCLLNTFDLIFTLLACRHEGFTELNPIARKLIADPSTLIAFKITFVGLGSIVLFWFRTHPLAEIGCWGVCAFYSILAGVWWRFYQALV